MPRLCSTAPKRPGKEVVLRKIPEAETLIYSGQMRVEFPFVEEKANIVPTILRPLARVKLMNEGTQMVVDMYVDSGADITLIPYSVGIAFGVV